MSPRTLRRQRLAPRIARSERGLALMIVIVVLAALAIIAAPFALSMRGLESAALLGLQGEVARADLDLALEAARRQAQATHPFLDEQSRWSDDLAELQPPDLAERYPELLPRDPRGTVASVSLADEQGKVPLGSASVWLLGNLLGGRTRLSEPVTPADDVLPVAGTQSFPETGLLWIGREIVETSSRDARSFGDCRRGAAASALPISIATSHEAGAEVLDLRLLLLAQHGWQARPGAFQGFRRVDALREIGIYGEAGYSAAELESVRPYLSVHWGAPSFRDEQRVLAGVTGRDGGPELRVADGSRYGPGTVLALRLPDGRSEHNLVLSATHEDPNWRIALLLPCGLPLDEGAVRVAALAPAPVNINTCAPAVLTALLTGVGLNPVRDVINATEAEILAVALVAAEFSTDPLLIEPLFEEALAAGDISPLDLQTALAELVRLDLAPGDLGVQELATRLEGLTARRTARRVSASEAAALAQRLRSAAPRSPEELRAALDLAVGEGLLDRDQRDALLINAVDSADAALVGGTAPFAYASGGVFTLQASVSRNQANGREIARRHAREIVSVAPPEESAHQFLAQRDFDEALQVGARRSGWTSFPALLELAPPGEAVPGRAGRLPSRAGGLVGGRPAAAESLSGGFAALTPVRSALPDTEHFDGQRPANSPRGLGAARQLPLEALRPQLVSSQGLLGSFAVEFWFELSDVEAETVLFDGAADEIEDRVVIFVRDRQLVLRVDHTGLPDFEARLPEGRSPPGGEIRYAFDDGLQLLPGVPYHVAALIGGARDTRLALFVDGVPRGRRSFTTALTRDLPAGSEAIDVHVADTSGFPQSGVLRVGGEFLEFVKTSPGVFRAEPAGLSDPFGGRGRRGSVGAAHPATELVELAGWTRPLDSKPAARGNGTLASALDAFTVAEVDGAQLTDEIYMSVVSQATGQTIDVLLGTGLIATAATIPLRAADVPLEANSFQSSGGHALLVCDYGFDALTGATIADPSNPTVQTELGGRTKGGFLGGAEVIRYTAFDGTRLTGVSRNESGIPVATGSCPASDLLSATQPNLVYGGNRAWDVAREFVTTFDVTMTGAGIGLPTKVRVLVVPISVGVSGGELYADYHPEPESGYSGRPALTQIDLDFPEGANATEWIRWDTAADGLLVRDEAAAINGALNAIASSLVWNGDTSSVGEDLLERLDDELDFRGQAGTRAGSHAGGARVLPVHLLGGWFTPSFEPQLGVPGRHDAITLVNPGHVLENPGGREWHRVNHAALNDDDWGSLALVALRDPVGGDFRRAWAYNQEGEPTGLAVADLDLEKLFDETEDGQASQLALETLNADARLFTRMVCGPSGELPTRPPQNFHLNEDYSGRANAAPATIDELRFHAPQTPSPWVPDTGRYVLDEELTFEEDRQLELRVDEIELPHSRKRGALLGADALEVLSELPQAGGLLLIGEEIVGYAGLDPTDSGAVYLTQRGLYGTARAHHAREEAVTPLLFWPASPLAASLTADEASLVVEDGAQFPAAGGLLWVDDELIGYVGNEDGLLTMPARGGGSRASARGLLRGRFGTLPAPHDAGAMVRWMPERLQDRALLGEDEPESQSLVLTVRAPGAFFTDLIVTAQLPLPGVELALRAVHDRLASPHDDPALRPALLAGSLAGREGEGERRLALPLRRQADLLELYCFALWGAGAFDATGHASNAWKLGPEIKAVTVGNLQPTLVLEREEWR
ncbi:MAG: hypothetical protein ACT4PU_13570 [Planctomycetota bacterium]